MPPLSWIAAKQGRGEKRFVYRFVVNDELARKNWLQKRLHKKLDRHIVRGALRSAEAPLVIDLDGSDLTMTEQVLDFPQRS